MNPGGVVGPNFGPGSCSVPSAGGGGGSGAIAGSLTTTYTWTADSPTDTEPPPLNVVVVESCSVSMSAQAYPGSTTATASNGLDARFCTNTSTSNVPIFYYPGYQIGSGSGAFSSGTAARVMSGGQTVTVTCAPAGTCASGNGPYSAYVDYSVYVLPVKLTLSNSVKDESIHFTEPGRPLSVSLNLGGDLQGSSYSYELGEDPYWFFNIDDEANEFGYVEPLSSSPNFPGSSVDFRLVKPGLHSLMATAQVKYKGVSIGSVSADELVVLEGPENVEVVQHASVNGLYYSLYGIMYGLSSKDDSFAIGTDPPETVGFAWTWSGDLPAHFPYAQLSSCQLINFVTFSGVSSHSSNGEYVLDHSYPYLNQWFVPDINSAFSCLLTDTPSLLGSLNPTLFVTMSFENFLMYRRAEAIPGGGR